MRALLKCGRAIVKFDLDAGGWCSDDKTEGRGDSSKELGKLHVENDKTVVGVIK